MQSKVFLLCLLLASNGTSSDGSILRRQRLVFARPIGIQNAKFVLQIATVATLPPQHSEPHCVGSLIRPNWVITAAHCVFCFPASYLQVIGNATRFDRQEAVMRRVQEKHIPDSYRPGSVHYDLALLQLVTPMWALNAMPIVLNTNVPVVPQDVLFIYGFGAMRPFPEYHHGSLHCARLTTLSYNNCYRKFPKYYARRTMLCSQHGVRGILSVFNDGAPIVRNGDLVAIMSSTVRQNQSGNLFDFSIKLAPLEPWMMRKLDQDTSDF